MERKIKCPVIGCKNGRLFDVLGHARGLVSIIIKCIQCTNIIKINFYRDREPRAVIYELRQKKLQPK